MASLKVLHRMENIEKQIHRSAETAVINAVFPKDDGGYLVTLGGCYIDKAGKLIKHSEMWYFIHVLGWSPKRIVSVDLDKEVIERNNKGKLGVRNVWMPIKGHRMKDCPVKHGEIGGIEKVVRDMVKEGKRISVVNADLMGTVRIMAPTVIGIMQALNTQMQKALLTLNFSINDRANGGKYNVTDALLRGKESRNGQTFKQAARLLWTEIPLTINGHKHFGYTGNHTPMEAAFFLKGTGKKKMVEVIERMKRAKKTTSFKDKSPKMVEAGRKAYRTRLANLKKAAAK
jgi:hypothetical protein